MTGCRLQWQFQLWLRIFSSWEERGTPAHGRRWRWRRLNSSCAPVHRQQTHTRKRVSHAQIQVDMPLRGEIAQHACAWGWHGRMHGAHVVVPHHACRAR
jgi:hypothetical protein